MIKFICGEEKELQVDILLSLINSGNYKMGSSRKYLKKVKYPHQGFVIVLYYMLKNIWLFMEVFLKHKSSMIGIV